MPENYGGKKCSYKIHCTSNYFTMFSALKLLMLIEEHVLMISSACSW
jgi:hypothetical protein